MPEPGQPKPPQVVREKLKNNRVIRLDPPEAPSIPKNFTKLVGQETTNKHIQELFASKYFKLVQEDIEERFQGKNVGLRAILCSNTEEKINVNGQRRPLSTVKEILQTGGDINNLTTRITILGETTPEEDIHTDMSSYYLSLFVKQAIKSGEKEVVPAILVYDLSLKGVTRTSGYEIKFVTEKVKKESLLAIYVLDTSPLLPQTNLKEILP